MAFLATVLLVTALIHLYLWQRLVRDTTPRGRARRLGGFAVLALALLIPATLIGTWTGVHWLAWLAWPGYLWIAVMFYLLVVLAVLELPLLVARLWLRRRPAAAVPPPAAPKSPGADRRLLLARGAAIFAGLTAVGITGYGVRTALGDPLVRRVQIPLAKLARGGDGLRIALVADIHLGPILGRAHTSRIVDRINRLDADIVAVVGDLVDGTVAELGHAAEPLRDLRSRYGSFFVTGNHEYFSGYRAWIDEVRSLGLRPLQNERLELVHNGVPLDLAGVNDVSGGSYGDRPDFGRALDDRDRDRPVILLAHQPVQVREAARHGVDLQLSGHTHGGQMVPFNLVVAAVQPIVSGLATIDGTQVYVTNGAGFWGPPVRVGAPPEISLVELRAA